MDVKAVYRSADVLKEGRSTFDLGANKYRLFARTNFVAGITYVRFVGTHTEYDRIDALMCKGVAMDIKPIRNAADHAEALEAIAALMESNPGEGTAAFDRLDILATLVESYETRYQFIDAPDPVAAILVRMAEKGWNNRQLAAHGGIAESKISEVLGRKRALSLGMIRALASLLDIPVAVLVETSEIVQAA